MISADTVKVLNDADFDAKLERSGNVLVFVSDAHSGRFQFSADMLAALKIHRPNIVFKTKAFHDSFVAVDDFFASPCCSFFNHLGRDDDSEIYANCQDLSRDILRGCDFTAHSDIADDLQIVLESAALYASEDWVIFQRVFLMLAEQVESLDIKFVVLVGSLNFSVCMARCLAFVGIESYISKPTDMDDDRLVQRVLYSFRNSHDKVMAKTTMNFDLKTVASTLEKAIKESDLACIVRVGDAGYAQNVSALIDQYADLKVLVLDNFSVDGTKEAIDNLLPNATNIAYADIMKNLSCFSYGICKYISRQIALSISRYDDQFVEFNGRKLHSTFFHYNSNNFFRAVVHSITYYRLFRRAFKHARPKVGMIVTPGRRIESRVAVVAAREQGIATYDLQFGGITRSKRFWLPNADHILCSDSISYRVFADYMGVDASRVHLVGSPRLDLNVAPYRAARPAVSGRELRIFLALQPLRPEITAAMVQAAIDACARLGNCSLNVGFHPRESDMTRSLVRSILETSDTPCQINEGPSLAGAAASDVCVTFYSFLGVEAFALGCHVIGLNVGREEWPFRLSAIGIAAEAYDAAELEALLRAVREGRSIIEGGDTDELDRLSRAALSDGKSADRIRHILQPDRTAIQTRPRPGAAIPLAG